MTGHITTFSQRPSVDGWRFAVRCSCGWSSGWCRTAGMAHGAEAAHVDAVTLRAGVNR